MHASTLPKTSKPNVHVDTGTLQKADDNKYTEIDIEIPTFPNTFVNEIPTINTETPPTFTDNLLQPGDIPTTFTKAPPTFTDNLPPPDDFQAPSLILPPPSDFSQPVKPIKTEEIPVVPPPPTFDPNFDTFPSIVRHLDTLKALESLKANQKDSPANYIFINNINDFGGNPKSVQTSVDGANVVYDSLEPKTIQNLKALEENKDSFLPDLQKIENIQNLPPPPLPKSPPPPLSQSSLPSLPADDLLSQDEEITASYFKYEKMTVPVKPPVKRKPPPPPRPASVVYTNPHVDTQMNQWKGYGSTLELKDDKVMASNFTLYLFINILTICYRN